MADVNSVTEWIQLLKQGQRDAAEPLWCRYVERIIRLANRKLAETPRRMSDEEDVAICAFEAFLRGVEAGRFHRLDDRHDLWQILVMLTERKAVDHIRAELASKRGGGQVRGESALGTLKPGIRSPQLAAAEPPPEFALQVTEEFGRLLQKLSDDQLQKVAVAKMEGYTNAEVARQLGISVSSIERKLALIRDIWAEERG